MKLISKYKKHFHVFFYKLKYFGFKIAFYHFMEQIIKIFPKSLVKKKHITILSWLSKNYDDYINIYKEHYSAISIIESSIPQKIWVCWWDGFSTMPLLVNVCYNSVLKHAKDFQITLITKYNFSNYISIPEHIIEKVNSKIITITHLSDIIRMALLSKYGGLWLDATVFVTGNINIDNNFFTIHRDLDGDNISGKRWTGNCIGGSPNLLLFTFIYDFFCEYWKKHTGLVDHHLIDYLIALAYNSFPEIKEMIDNVKKNNPNYMVLEKHLKYEYNPHLFDELIKDTVFHKLKWYKKYPVMTPDNKLTFYGYISQNYSNNG